ncbi:MAG: ATP synthase F1 subunit delta [Candidatus Moranbacteria bacterium]|nr:ATP synthase F1 subunit delta [bacterium]MDP1833587.1 ATP synthase F1 subunit delta [Candidatus Moranbacteria bacterium]
MRLSVNQYAKALYASVKDKSQGDIGLVVANLLNLLRKNGQMKSAGKIIDNFSVIWNKENGIVEAEITSREALDKASQDGIKEFIAGKYAAKEVIVSNIVDEDIRGGIIIRIGDELIDASVRRRLTDLGKSLGA